MKQTASRRIRRAGKTLTALVLAFALIAGPGYPAAPEAEAASLSDLQQKQKELKEKQAENQEKLDQLKEDASKQKEYKETLDAQIDNLEAQISGLNSQIAQMDSEIKKKNSEIADKQKSIDKNMELLKERLCALYDGGGQQPAADPELGQRNGHGREDGDHPYDLGARHRVGAGAFGGNGVYL